MVEVSCYHIHANRNERHIAFIRFEKYIKVILSSYRTIILSIEDFMTIPDLFEYYLLSLVITEDTTKIIYEPGENRIGNPLRYGISTEMNWKRMYFTDYYSKIFLNISKNPFKSLEPKRQTSDKKIRKFIKHFSEDFEDYGTDVLFELINSRCRKSEIMIENLEKEVKKEEEFKKRIKLLTGIKKRYGVDVYSLIIKYM